MIFICWASLEKSIYVVDGVGGFTSQVDKFVEANTQDDASEAYRDFLEKKGIRVRTVKAKVRDQAEQSHLRLSAEHSVGDEGRLDWRTHLEWRQRV